MLGLAAKYADAYHTVSVEDPTAAKSLFAITDDACRRVGRDPATLQRTSGCSLGLEGFEDVPAGPPGAILHGSNAEIVDKLAAFAATGITVPSFAPPNLSNIPAIPWKVAIQNAAIYGVPLPRARSGWPMYVNQSRLDEIGAPPPRNAETSRNCAKPAPVLRTADG